MKNASHPAPFCPALSGRSSLEIPTCPPLYGRVSLTLVSSWRPETILAASIIEKIISVSRMVDNAVNRKILDANEWKSCAMMHTAVYIQRAVSDLRAAIARYSAVTDATQTARLDELKPALDPISQAARPALATACADPMALDIQSMERALNAL